MAAVILPLLVLATGRSGEISAASVGVVLAMATSGLLGFGFGDAIYTRALALEGLQRTFPVVQAVFLSTTTIGGVLLLGEPFDWSLPFGALFVGTGSYVLVVRAAPVAVPVEPLPTAGDESAGVRTVPSRWTAMEGYAALLVAPLLWTTATMLLAGQSADLGALAAGALRTPAAAVGMLAVTVGTRMPELRRTVIDRRTMAVVGVTALTGSVAGTLLYTFAVLEAGAARTAVLTGASPLLALPLSIAFLGERPSRASLVGTLLCVAGILLTVS
jgi:drug/metabolite transporter (DMT)-like permease